MSKAMQSITFSGFVGDGLGIALWQADGSGPEPAATGHTFITPIEPITAHYYVASRDYVDASARGGLVATGVNGAWPKLTAALKASRSEVRDIVMRVPLTTAGPDREGEDWFFRDGVETRYMHPQAPLLLALAGTLLLEFAPPCLTLTEDYRNVRDFSEVKISLASEPTPVRPARRALDGPYRAVVEAFLSDSRGRPVRFVVDAIRLSPVEFSGHGRTHARFAEIPSARVQIA